MPGRSVGTAAWDATLSVPGSPVCAPDWLALRERADVSAGELRVVVGHVDVLAVPTGAS